MIEHQWLTSHDSGEMMEFLEFLNFRTLIRKKRLLGAAACDRVRGLLDEQRWRDALTIYESGIDRQLSDAEADEQHLVVSHMAFRLSSIPVEPLPPPPMLALSAVSSLTSGNCRHAVFTARQARWSGQHDLVAESDNESRHQADLLRDIFGNPFRRASFSPAWYTSTALSLASQMYESRDFGAMPILADALQDAECDNEDILDHCRGPGPHVRGCWVVDLVLGKE